MPAGLHALALVTLLFITNTKSEALPIEAYGDSVTAGFLSGTDVTEAPPLKTISRIFSDMVMFKLSGDAKHLIPHHRKDLAWPAHLARLQIKDPAAPEQITVINAAVSGAKTQDLLGQVRAARDLAVTSQSFFFVGHNDLCNNPTEPEALAKQFIEWYEAALTEWDTRHENATAYVIPIADISQVYRVLKGYAWYEGDKATYTCEDSWNKFFPYCTSHHKKALAGTLEAYLAPRLTAMNGALRKLAEKWDGQSGKNRFRYLTDAPNVAFKPEFFAVDCYHLSDRGQQTLAQEVFKQLVPVTFQ